jgi:transcriptional regulator with XRE-family HTH domain
MRRHPSGEPGVQALKKRIARRLTEFRRKRGLSRRELATLLELPVDSIEAFEDGERLPRTYTLYCMALALNINAGEFMADESERLKGTTHNLMRRLEDLPAEPSRILLEFFELLLTMVEQKAAGRVSAR